MMRSRSAIEGPDKFDIVSAIWILSSNDENPIITYRGVAFRLGLPDDFDVKALVASRAELFRPGITRNRLSAWKEKLRADTTLPSWIREIDDKNARAAVIDALGPTDVFRNQFRAAEGAGKCELEVIKWGLEHIERLRKATAEAREEKTKKWATIVIPLGSMLVALVSIITGAVIAYQTTAAQTSTKYYEITLKPKQESYSSLLAHTFRSYEAAIKGDSENMYQSLNRMELAFYQLEPLLDESSRIFVWNWLQNFETFCNQQRGFDRPSRDASVKEFTARCNELRDALRRVLFEEPPHRF